LSDISNKKENTMPVYEFECSSCGSITEQLTKMGTEEIICPNCQKKAKKIISRCTFELKGGGWYADGYAAKKK
jgi:putative FmdB family regulatory protein